MVSSITFDSKIDMLISYYKKNGQYPYIDLQDGNNYEYIDNKKINKEKYFEGSLIGVVVGKFAAKRIYPPVESAISIADDIKNFKLRQIIGDMNLSNVDK